MNWTKAVTLALKKLFKRRSAPALSIVEGESVIGHAKTDHGLDRNSWAGKVGDEINVLLVGCGFNFAKLLRFFAAQPPQPVAA